MADLPSRQDLFAVGRRTVRTTSGLRINPRVIDVQGSDLNLVIGASSVMGEEVVARLAGCIRGLFVETAREDALDRVAFDRYGLTRFPATPATVDISLSRPTAAGGAGTYPAGSRIRTETGTEFAIDNDIVFGASDLTKEGTASALVAGPGGNVVAGAINAFVDQPFDTTLTVVNPTGAAGGINEESDALFRGRIRDFFPTVRRGTLGAIEFGARQVPGIAVATAFEVQDIVNGSFIPAAGVQLIVADAQGGISSVLLQNVIDTLIDFRAAGIPVFVTGGTIINQAVTWDIDFDAGVDTVSVSESIRAVTVATAQFLNPGETLFRSSLIASARQVPGAIVRDTSLVVPVGDVVPNDNTEILRILSTEVTFV